MLEWLHLKNVGPAPEMELELGPRLNLITGDNGLGKSFLLDVAWWALTRRWPRDINDTLTSGYPARPTDAKAPAEIAFRLTSKVKRVRYESRYSARDQAWIGKPGRPWNPGLIIYAHADGGFSVWDPARNYWKKKGNEDVQERPPGYVFSPKDVWDGLEVAIDGKRAVISNGLLRDWATWIRERGPSEQLMAAVLGALAPDGESLSTGPLTRISLDEGRDIPTIRTAYSDAVPILHASSGVRRAVGLAYMLVWSWNEHFLAAKQLGEEPTTQVIMLIDEIESHLHPRWQRSILSSVLHVTERLHNPATIQLIAATHSPLILASAEPMFDPEKDAWFDLDLLANERRVTITKRPFVRRGTAGRWLTSEAFDLVSEGRSREAESAIVDAEALLDRHREGTSPSAEEILNIDLALRAVLPDVDRFWIRWSAFVDEQRAAS